MLNFLSGLFERNLAYRTIGVYRSTLSQTLAPIDGVPVGEHPLVSRLMRGVHNTRPPERRIAPAWSVDKVLDTVRQWSPVTALSLKTLTLKTVLLLALVTGKRCSSLALLSVKETHCQFSSSRVQLRPRGLEKTSRPGHTVKAITVEACEDLDLDPVSHMKEYVARTQPLRKTEVLFVTLTKPHTAAKRTTLASWLKQAIALSGQWGSAGSTRSVSTSTALNRGVSLEEVLEAADWTRSSTFSRHYYRPDVGVAFGTAVLAATQ